MMYTMKGRDELLLAMCVHGACGESTNVLSLVRAGLERSIAAGSIQVNVSSERSEMRNMSEC